MNQLQSILPAISIILIVSWIIAEAFKPSVIKQLKLEREEYHFILDQIQCWDDPRWSFWIENRMEEYKARYRSLLSKGVFEQRCRNLNQEYGKKYTELHDLYMRPIEEFIGYEH